MKLDSVSAGIELNSLKRFRNRRSICVLTPSFILLLIALFAGPGSLLLRSLETRFVWRQVPTDEVVGIVLLGGFHLDSSVLASRRVDIRSDLAERIMETVRLSTLYPKARILYSGGGMEAQLGKKVLMRLGVERERII